MKLRSGTMDVRQDPALSYVLACGFRDSRHMYRSIPASRFLDDFQ